MGGTCSMNDRDKKLLPLGGKPKKKRPLRGLKYRWNILFAVIIFEKVQVKNRCSYSPERL
jgi:hypothetical protein